MSKSTLTYAMAWILVGSFALALAAAPSADSPTPKAAAKATTQPAAAGEMAHVKSVKPSAQWWAAGTDVVDAKDLKWKAVKQGDDLVMHTIVRTGSRGKIVIVFPDAAVIEVGRGSKIGLAQFRREAGKPPKVRIGQKFGVVKMESMPGKGKIDFQLRTPHLVAAMRGTGGTSIVDELGSRLDGDHGVWQILHLFNRRNRSVARGQQGNDKMTHPKELLEKMTDQQLVEVFGLPDKEKTSNHKFGGGFGYNRSQGQSGGGTHFVNPIVPNGGNGHDNGNGGGNGNGSENGGGESIDPPPIPT